uniref:Sulfotransfer_1 domain-containing protein n=1 Tax=Strongyloides venezuelensis TaxID=75913 RepID=A0A0K0FPT4_STRVS
MKLLNYLATFVFLYINLLDFVTTSKKNIPCSSFMKEYECLPHSQARKNNYFVLKKYKLNVCSIGKNFSSMIGAIFCYLFNDKLFLSKHKHLNEDYWATRACGNKFLFNNIRQISNKYNVKISKLFQKNWKHFIIIRNPIERFLSGFTHICVKTMNDSVSLSSCYHCEGNMECVLKNLYKTLQTYSYNRTQTTFHIRYHFFPQSWLCHYDKYKKHYIKVKYESMDKEKFYSQLINIFRSQNIPKKKIEYINWELYHSKSFHTTNGTNIHEKQREILFNNPYLLKLLSIIYYEDFIEFGYKFPIGNFNKL